MDRPAHARKRSVRRAGALAPVDVDHQRDLACYTEPNVWVRHEVR
jgi:hypothetical protein